MEHILDFSLWYLKKRRMSQPQIACRSTIRKYWYYILILKLKYPGGRNAQFSSVQSLSHVWLFATPWIEACQASLSITNSRSSLRLTSIESVMPSNLSSSVVPFSSCPQSFPASGSFPMSQLFASGSQNIGASALLMVLLIILLVFVHCWSFANDSIFISSFFFLILFLNSYRVGQDLQYNNQQL